MTRPIAHNLASLRVLLESLSALDCSAGQLPHETAVELSESFRDCRLELMRLESHKLSDTQLHRLQQLDNRLQMKVSGHGSDETIAPEAKRALASFGWGPDA